MKRRVVAVLSLAIYAASLATAQDDSQAVADAGRQAPLRMLKGITVIVYPVTAKDANTSAKDLMTSIQLQLRQSRIEFAAYTFADGNSGETQRAKAEHWPILKLTVTADRESADSVYDLSVELKLSEFVASPHDAKAIVTATYWTQTEFFFAGADRLSDQINRSVDKLTKQYCNDWLAAHSDTFKYPSEFKTN